MKKGLFLALMILPLLLHAVEWSTYTNTSHIFDAIRVDNKLFLATWGGLVEYNVTTDANPLYRYQERKTYTNIDGMSDIDTRSLTALTSSSHMIWAGTNSGGVNRLNLSNSAFEAPLTASLGLPSNQVTKMVQRDTLYYVATTSGVSIFYTFPGFAYPAYLFSLDTSTGLSNNVVNDMTFMDNGYLFIATNRGLNYAHVDSLSYLNSWHVFNVANSEMPGDSVYTISAKGNTLAIGTNKGLAKLSFANTHTTWKVWQVTDGLAEKYIHSVYIDRMGQLWLSYGKWNDSFMEVITATATALTMIDANDRMVSWTVSSGEISTPMIQKITEIDGQIWLLTWGDGAIIHKDDNWVTLRTNSIGFNTVTTISTTEDGDIWFGSGYKGAAFTAKGTRGISSLVDGLWASYTHNSSPLTSDNTIALGIDSKGRKWVGSWDVNPMLYPFNWVKGVTIIDDIDANNIRWYKLDNTGLYEYNEALSTYILKDATRKLIGNTISFVQPDNHGNMIVGCYDNGLSVFDGDLNKVRDIRLGTASAQEPFCFVESDYGYHFGTLYSVGLITHTGSELPTSDSPHWQNAPLGMTGVYGGNILDLAVRESAYGQELWIVSTSGVFMYDGVNWYKYDTDIKRRIWSDNTWQRDVLYYVDEARLFDSVRTQPTAVLVDPFNRVWLASQDNGISMYDSETDRFISYNRGNSPLISNTVTALGYEGKSGKLYIGTADGLSTLNIGKSVIKETKLRNVVAFPNPFYPDKGGIVNIANLPEDEMPIGKNRCAIYDLSGDLVIELKQDVYARFHWDGLNEKGKKCSSGVYLYVVTHDDGSTVRGKIALIR